MLRLSQIDQENIDDPSFAGAKHPDEQVADLDEVGQHWTHVAMARESRLILEVIVGPRKSRRQNWWGREPMRLATGCWPLLTATSEDEGQHALYLDRHTIDGCRFEEPLSRRLHCCAA